MAILPRAMRLAVGLQLRLSGCCGRFCCRRRDHPRRRTRADGATFSIAGSWGRRGRGGVGANGVHKEPRLEADVARKAAAYFAKEFTWKFGFIVKHRGMAHG